MEPKIREFFPMKIKVLQKTLKHWKPGSCSCRIRGPDKQRNGFVS